MPRSDCSALHGVNPNFKKKQNKTKKTRNSSDNIEKVSFSSSHEENSMEADCVWATQDWEVFIEVEQLKGLQKV